MLEFVSSFPDAWLALAGALFGGGGLKAIEHWLTKSKVKDDSQAEFRKELRTDLDSCRLELRAVQKKQDEWQEKYYLLLEQFIAVKSQIDVAHHAMKDAGLVEEVPTLPTLQEIIEKELKHDV